MISMAAWTQSSMRIDRMEMRAFGRLDSFRPEFGLVPGFWLNMNGRPTYIRIRQYSNLRCIFGRNSGPCEFVSLQKVCSGREDHHLIRSSLVRFSLFRHSDCSFFWHRRSTDLHQSVSMGIYKTTLIHIHFVSKIFQEGCKFDRSEHVRDIGGCYGCHHPRTIDWLLSIHIGRLY